MRLIAWDTSSTTGVVCALEGASGETPRLVAALTLNVEARHSERLLWSVHQVLESARWQLDSVDVLGVGVGPGSFTGLRMGITTAKALAFASARKLVAVSSLQALVRPAALACVALGVRAYVLAATEASKGEVFSTLVRADRLTRARGELREQAIAPERLMATLRRALERDARARWIVLGELADVPRALTRAWPKRLLAREIAPDALAPALASVLHPSPAAVAELAWRAAEEQRWVSPLELTPRYLRVSDAERKRAERAVAAP